MSLRENSDWNDTNEKIIISIGENAASFKWMHERCSNKHKLRSSILNITSIILTTVLSVTTFFNNDCQTQNLTYDIVQKGTSYSLSVLSLIQNFLKSSELYEQHKTASANFNEIYHNIQRQMAIFRKNRPNANTYIADCIKQYDSCIINSPNIGNDVLKSFKKTFKNANFSIPDTVGNIQKIEIVSENEITNQAELNENSIQLNINQSNNNLYQINRAINSHSEEYELSRYMMNAEND